MHPGASHAKFFSGFFTDDALFLLSNDDRRLSGFGVSGLVGLEEEDEVENPALDRCTAIRTFCLASWKMERTKELRDIF